MDCTFHGDAKRQTQLSDFHFQVALVVNNPLASARDARDCVWSLDHEASLQKGIAAHSSILPCKMPWTEEPAALQSMGSQRVRRNWATKRILHIRQKQGHIKCNTMSNKYITNDKRIFHFFTASLPSCFHGLPRWHLWWRIHLLMQETLDPWVRKIPWSRTWQFTLVFLPGKFHWQRSLASYNLWGLTELGMTEWLRTHTHFHRRLLRFEWVLCDNLEGWNGVGGGRVSQEGGGIYIIMADLCYCTGKTSAILQLSSN